MKVKNKKMDYLVIARKVLSIEMESIKALSESLNSSFTKAVDIILNCRDRVVLTGMGKSGIICSKIAATFTSTGTQSIFMHPSDAMHGDLGIIRKNEVVLAISHSGETREIVELLPHLKLLKSKIIAVTSKSDSTLAGESDVVLAYTINREGCPLNLAPMASTTTMLALGDALAAALIQAKGIKEEDFYRYHPMGRLGQILLRVSDLMVRKNLPVVQRETPVHEVVKNMISANYGAVLVAGSKGHLRGIITDGDIKRLIQKDGGFLSKKAIEVANKNPQWIREGSSAREALMIMENQRITVLPVLDEAKKISGLIQIHDIVKHNYGKNK